MTRKSLKVGMRWGMGSMVATLGSNPKRGLWTCNKIYRIGPETACLGLLGKLPLVTNIQPMYIQINIARIANAVQCHS